MYQALYRKWRPLRFADVVGQNHITDTLRAQLESGRLSHAWLCFRIDKSDCHIASFV